MFERTYTVSYRRKVPRGVRVRIGGAGQQSHPWKRETVLALTGAQAKRKLLADHKEVSDDTHTFMIIWRRHGAT